MGVTVKEKVLGSGVFWVFINHKGKRKSKRVGSEDAALQVKSVIEAKLKLGQALPNDEPTAPKLCVYYEKYRQNYLETALRRTTRRRHEGNFRNYLLPLLGHLRLDEITRDKMQELIAGLVRKKLVKDSIRLIVAAICGLYTFAIENKAVKENPTIKVE